MIFNLEFPSYWLREFGKALQNFYVYLSLNANQVVIVPTSALFGRDNTSNALIYPALIYEVHNKY